MISLNAAVAYTFAAGLAVFLCRALPFFIIRPGSGGSNAVDDSDAARVDSNTTDKSSDTADSGAGDPAPHGEAARTASAPAPRGAVLDACLSRVERVVPPVAMTVLAVNSIAAPVKEGPAASVPVLAAAALTLGVQLWKRNYLVSILGGTAAYMVLTRLWG
jgi:branched-subunit amino acid transport protein AzlD